VLHDDDAIYEFNDDHFLVTSLFNYTMPLIRYRIDDVISEPRFTRDRPYLQAAAILGRTERVVSFVNEDGLTEDLNGMSLPVFYQERVMRCQLQRLGNCHFRYLVWPRPDLPASQQAVLQQDVEEQVSRVLKMKRLANVTFEVALTEELNVDPVTRKFPLVVDLAPTIGTP
jgi:phenylacetate-CoA ligase